MAKQNNPYLKKATGTAKAPVSVDRKRHGLGRGLGSLIPEASAVPLKVAAPASSASGGELELRILDIERSPYQPRRDFAEDELRELADSLKKSGLVQPPTVRKNSAGKYELIAGERRIRAAQIAGWEKIRVTLVEADDLTAAAMTTTENLQREDLNPVEEAMAYDALIDRFGLKQEEVAQQVGKSRSAIANMLRLLDLPDEVLELLRDGSISTGHARTLLALEDEENILPLANKIVSNNMSVRELENAVKKLNSIAKDAAEAELAAPSPYKMMAKSHMKNLETRSTQSLGRKVRIIQTARKRVVELSFDSNDDLEALLVSICGQDIFKED